MVDYHKNTFLLDINFRQKEKTMKIKVIVTFLALVICGSHFTGLAEAEDFIWGTEGQGTLISDYANIPEANQNIINILKNELNLKYIKIRIRLPVDGEFTPDLCTLRGAFYSGSDPACSQQGAAQFNLDETVKVFKENNWSMFPMFSHAGGPGHNVPIDTAHIERYVEFVDWFVGRYKKDGNIQFIELINAPSFTWKGTEQQLLELNNKTYERIKSKYSEIQIGTPGFEYFRDAPEKNSGRKHTRFRDYFLDSDAKFDFWAFHGYPTRGEKGLQDIYPPTRTAKHDTYSGISGIARIRKKLNERGWSERKIIDAENTGVLGFGIFNENDDKLNAAYMVQQLTLKRTLNVDGKTVLSGIISMKILPHKPKRGGKRGAFQGGSPGMRGPAGGRPKMGPPGGAGRPPRGQFQGGTRRPLPGKESGMDEQQAVGGGESPWGSLNSDGSVSLTVKAVGLYLSMLGNSTYIDRISGNFDSNQVWIEKFGDGKKELYVCFKPFEYGDGRRFVLDSRKSNCTINFKTVPSKITSSDIFGNRLELVPQKSFTHSVGNVPEIIEVRY
jgi:hypothetical protein